MGKRSREQRRQTNRELALVDTLAHGVADYFTEVVGPWGQQCVQAAGVLVRAAAANGVTLEPLATSLAVVDLQTNRGRSYGQPAADFLNEIMRPETPLVSSATADFPQGHMVVRHTASGQVWDPLFSQLGSLLSVPVRRVAFQPPVRVPEWDFACSEAGVLTANPFASIPLDYVTHRFVWVYFPDLTGVQSWRPTYDLMADIHHGVESEIAAKPPRAFVGTNELRGA